MLLPGGKQRTLENMTSSQELLWDYVEKVNLRLAIEAESKSGAVLKKRKKKGKKNKNAPSPSAWFVDSLARIQVEEMVLQFTHGDFLVCRREERFCLVVNDGGTACTFMLRRAEDGAGFYFLGKQHSSMDRLIDYAKCTAFRGNHVRVPACMRVVCVCVQGGEERERERDGWDSFSVPE